MTFFFVKVDFAVVMNDTGGLDNMGNRGRGAVTTKATGESRKYKIFN